jgi:hypothetical protein
MATQLYREGQTSNWAGCNDETAIFFDSNTGMRTMRLISITPPCRRLLRFGHGPAATG